jgi:hypothetical protein
MKEEKQNQKTKSKMKLKKEIQDIGGKYGVDAKWIIRSGVTCFNTNKKCNREVLLHRV